MTSTDADHCRATGVWPTRPMTPLEPLPPRLRPRPSGLRRVLAIAWGAIVALVCIVFLLHVRSALVAVITLPIGVLIAYLCMYVLGLSSNIMSLGGIAIAIGAMVDAAIVMIENAHKHLERALPWPRRRSCP